MGGLQMALARKCLLILSGLFIFFSGFFFIYKGLSVNVKTCNFACVKKTSKKKFVFKRVRMQTLVLQQVLHNREENTINGLFLTSIVLSGVYVKHIIFLESI